VIATGRPRPPAPEPRLPGVAADRTPLVPVTHWASLARAAYGAALLCAPGYLIAAATGCPASRRARVTARVLGARHLAQAAICGAMPVRGLIEAGTAVDSLHAASMFVLASADRDRRAALLADALVATAFAAAATAALRD
jgi:hypothetical protein